MAPRSSARGRPWPSARPTPPVRDTVTPRNRNHGDSVARRGARRSPPHVSAGRRRRVRGGVNSAARDTLVRRNQFRRDPVARHSAPRRANPWRGAPPPSDAPDVLIATTYPSRWRFPRGPPRGTRRPNAVGSAKTLSRGASHHREPSSRPKERCRPPLTTVRAPFHVPDHGNFARTF